MKTKLTKILSMILCVLMLTGMLVPMAAAAENINVPIVFVGGRGTRIDNAQGSQIYPTPDMKPYIKEQAKTIMPLFMKAVLTDNYEEYADALINAVKPVYKDFKLDESGKPVNGTHNPYSWSINSLKRKVRGANDPYRMNDFRFYYDWRLDLWETADELKQYIEDVCTVTGVKKVRLVGRCLGGNLVAAYITKYGGDRVEKCMFHMTTANGTELVGSLFSGQVNFNADAVTRFATDALGDDTLDEFIRCTLNLYDAQTGMRSTISFAKYIYGKISPLVMPELLLNSYGSCPSYWEMINHTQYEAAKKTVFKGREALYNDFIKKTDNYHYNVMLPLYSTIKKLQSDGVKFYIIAKYGKQLPPITNTPDYLTDNTVELQSASFGATCAGINGTLTEEYIKGREKGGYGKYISPDKQVDASTCLLPEKTWIVKFSEHKDFCGAMDNMMYTILRYEGDMTVRDNPSYPQFMVEDEKVHKLYPMTAENAIPEKEYNPGFFSALKSFFAFIIRYIINYFENGFIK